MKRARFLTAAVLALAPLACAADSLWKNDTQSLVSDLKPHQFKLHDLITIEVDDSSSASTSADTRLDRRMRWETILTKWLQFEMGKKSLKANQGIGGVSPEINLDARLRRESPASTGRKGSILGTITAEVVDVKENGNLVVEAKKHRQVNDEVETMTISGELRPQDVKPDNTASSDRVASLDVRYTGVGPVGDTQRPGIIEKILSKLWPF